MPEDRDPRSFAVRRLGKSRLHRLLVRHVGACEPKLRSSEVRAFGITVNTIIRIALFGRQIGPKPWAGASEPLLRYRSNPLRLSPGLSQKTGRSRRGGEPRANGADKAFAPPSRTAYGIRAKRASKANYPKRDFHIAWSPLAVR
jgi:hypothetical protein